MLERLLAWVKPAREPDKVLYSDDNQPFLRRWYLLPRNPVFEVFVNNFMSSDRESLLHNHPSFTLSLICRGRYFEHLEGAVAKERRAGQWLLRSPWMYHRIEIKPGEESWSIFITGPKIHEWSFMGKDGRIPHHEVYEGKRDD